MLDILFLLFLLQLKHFYIDFVCQTKTEIDNKGNYGAWLGFTHSLKHGVFTGLAVWCLLGYPGIIFATYMAALDLIAHYHIDYIKMRLGCKDSDQPKFWTHLGLDQFAHQITYILIAGLTLL